MMMIENDPETRAMITYRQQSLLAEAARYRAIQAPSPIRVALGLALIRMGERLRGCAQATSADATTSAVPASRLRPVHQA